MNTDNQLRVYQLWIDGSPTEICGEFTKRQVNFINDSYAKDGNQSFWLTLKTSLRAKALLTGK